ncbi:MAG: hypothetical protein VX220_00700 [Pseudomonadota bacterium]|nr:hypothetical protein [Pseudomonadota bacterium]
MLTISNSFNKFWWILPYFFALISEASAQLPKLSDSELQWLGEQIFNNECASQFECLTSWNPGERFPSLGIGHFIWYQQKQIEPFEETFPELLALFNERGIVLPDWLSGGRNANAPWNSRKQFNAQLQSSQMRELRQILATTKPVQVEFISRRLYQSINEIIKQFPTGRQQIIRDKVINLANSQTPYGLYALIDYLNFKGTGLNSRERYLKKGWGLLQVLQEMQHSNPTLENFVAAAGYVLERRVTNAPPQREEQRWLPGWKNRLQTYLPVQRTE